MGRKVKVKVKHGKAKIKLRSGDEDLPLSAADIRLLLANSVASALGAGKERSSHGELAEPQTIEVPRMLPERAGQPAADEVDI